ncbi:hypothetical protein [Marinobacterium stanieri]|uniref:hypothetical protein n=1 Tax=Marinobacterium stanieri TaxID=49186 RepID=UPI003A8F3B24
MRTLKYSLVLLWMLASPLQAAGLSATAIEAYLETLPQVRALAEQLEAKGQGDFLKREIMPGTEHFDPHQRGVRALEQQAPDAHAELGRIVTASGFTSAGNWAQTGDRVVLAYGAVKVEAESPEILALAQSGASLDPAMLQMLSPEMRVQMQQAMTMAKAIAQVPAADKQMIRPYIARLDQAFEQ